MNLIIGKEQQLLADKNYELARDLHLDFSHFGKQVKYVGLQPNLSASYYIGIEWLHVNETAIQINPKIENIDFMAMFLQCLSVPYLNEHLRKIYHIDLESPTIEADTLPCDITPMLIIHFLNVVKTITNKGLKKDYIQKEENLQSKIKGKLMFSQHVGVNVSKERRDRNYCHYQEYSVDCLENRLIKKTLLFVGSYLKRLSNHKQLHLTHRQCLSAFELVSDDVDPLMVKQVRINPIFKEYAEAIRLAKLILKRFAYSLSETTKENKKRTPPFWIDMSLLFEIYVFGKLREEYGREIHYQVNGRYGSVDFTKTDEKIVIDTKYKMIYNEAKYDIENIRQVSAYARDKGIRKRLKATEEELLNCCIIYPNQNQPGDFDGRELQSEKISQFEKFWKIGIGLPIQKTDKN